MTDDIRQPSPDDDWMMLDEACRVTTREKIAAWCRDGIVSSRTGLRVSRIRHLDIGMNDTISEENIALDPADWSPDALGDPQGPHWSGGEARFDSSGLLFGFEMALVGATLYRIQVHKVELNMMVTASLPKVRAGRPVGGGFQKTDLEIIDKMRAGLASGEFASPYAAGMHYAGEAKGSGSLEAKAKRLASRLSNR